MKIRDRVVELIKVDSRKLRPCPWNWRTHPERQREVLREVLGEIGVAGVVLVRDLGDGTYMLIDGHLRTEELKGKKVPAVVLDVTEEEAKVLLACYDPISGLAGRDAAKFKELAEATKVKGKRLSSLFGELAEEAIEVFRMEEDDERESDGKPCQVQMVMSAANKKEFAELIRSAAGGTTNLAELMLESLRRDNLRRNAQPPEDFKEVGEDLEVDHQCPKCGYRFSGGNGQG